MNVEVQLFGAFRQFQTNPRLMLELAPGSTVADVRNAIAAYAAEHWPECPSRLLKTTALATEQAVLRDCDPAPPHLAVLPPVSGG